MCPHFWSSSSPSVKASTTRDQELEESRRAGDWQDENNFWRAEKIPFSAESSRGSPEKEYLSAPAETHLLCRTTSKAVHTDSQFDVKNDEREVLVEGRRELPSFQGFPATLTRGPHIAIVGLEARADVILFL